MGANMWGPWGLILLAIPVGAIIYAALNHRRGKGDR